MGSGKGGEFYLHSTRYRYFSSVAEAKQIILVSFYNDCFLGDVIYK